MTQTSRRDHAQLLARARAALETPADLDADARKHLIEDLAAIEEIVANSVVPWPIDIHVGQIDHRYGSNVYATLTREALMAKVAKFCRDCWSEIEDPRAPGELTDEEASLVYFGQNLDDYLSTSSISCPVTEIPQVS